MLGALAFVTVRQHEDDAVEPPPLHFAACNELVDHHLRAVGEVAKLRLPNHQRTRRIGSVTIFKTQHRFFRKDGVDHGKGGLIRLDVLQRDVDAFVKTLALLVVQHGVAVGECATATVLPRDADWKAFRQQGGKRHVLAHAPVHLDFAAAHGGAVVQHLARQWVHVEIVWHLGNALGQTLPFRRRYGGGGFVRPGLVQKLFPVGAEVAFETTHHGVDGVAAFFQRGAVGLRHVVTQGVAQTLRGQLVGIQPAGAGMLADFFVHQRLGEHGGILLVVPQFAEADDVDHHVFVEGGAVLHGPLHAQSNRFGVVGIDVQHGCFHHLDHVGAVQRGAAVARVTGGKANLVVDNDVQRAASVVAACFGQRQRFHHHTLAGKGGIAMHQQRQYMLTLWVAATIHAGAHAALHHGVHNLQMRRVERQCEVQWAVRRGHVGAEALVVFHVAAGKFFGRGLLEFGKQVFGQLAQQIDQHVQATTVRHADDYFLQTAFARFAHHFVHGHDEAFAPFERKTFLPHVFAVQKTLQPFGCSQAIENAQLVLGIQHGLGTAAFELLLPPAFLVEVAGVHEFRPDGAGIGFAQRVEQVTQRHAVFAEKGVAGVENGFQISIGKTVEIQLQFRDDGALCALERIEIGPAAAGIAVRRNQLLSSRALAANVRILIGLLHTKGSLLGALGKCIDHGLVRHVFAVAAVGRGQVLKIIEILAPGIGHAGRIGQIVFVHLLHIRSVAAKQIGVGAVCAVNR